MCFFPGKVYGVKRGWNFGVGYGGIGDGTHTSRSLLDLMVDVGGNRNRSEPNLKQVSSWWEWPEDLL
jgi:hypothetical protein